MATEYKFNWINNTKVLATFLVIIIHVTSLYLVNNSTAFEFSAAEMLNSFSRVSVPLFVVISGYLNIREDNSYNLGEFYRKKVTRIVYSLIFWSLFFVLWSAIKNLYINGDINFNDLWLSLVFGRPYYHLWFLYMLLGLYLVTPFVFLSLKGLSSNTILYVISTLFFIVMFDDVYRRIFEIDKGFFLTWFFNYLPYYMLGYYLKNISFRIKPASSILMYILSAIFMFFLISYFKDNSIRVMLWSYFSLFTLAGTIGLLFFMMNFNHKENALIKSISKYMFGIYLVHPLFIDVFKFANLFSLSTNSILSIFIFSLVVMLVSLLFVYIISQFRFMQKVV